MKKALVCGAGGFIAGPLVKKLKREGYWVRGTDIQQHEYAATMADEFLVLDLREEADCRKALDVAAGRFDEVYQLAAECEIMHNNVLLNVHMTHSTAMMKIPRYFFSSSVCTYRDMESGEPEMTEAQAYPAHPDNEYGWEKLYSERVLIAYGLNKGIQVRIARFQNCYGPEGTWTGGREKAPARSAAKLPKRRTAGRSGCGAMGPRFAPTHTWTIWSKAFIF